MFYKNKVCLQLKHRGQSTAECEWSPRQTKMEKDLSRERSRKIPREDKYAEEESFRQGLLDYILLSGRERAWKESKLEDCRRQWVRDGNDNGLWRWSYFRDFVVSGNHKVNGVIEVVDFVTDRISTTSYLRTN